MYSQRIDRNAAENVEYVEKAIVPHLLLKNSDSQTEEGSHYSQAADHLLTFCYCCCFAFDFDSCLSRSRSWIVWKRKLDQF